MSAVHELKSDGSARTLSHKSSVEHPALGLATSFAEGGVPTWTPDEGDRKRAKKCQKGADGKRAVDLATTTADVENGSLGLPSSAILFYLTPYSRSV